MPDPDLLTPLGVRFRDSAPTILRGDPDYLGIWHATARECERLLLKIEVVRAQLFPQTADELLSVWEAEVGTTIAPAGKTLEERRQIVAARLLLMAGDPSGLGWQENVSALVGSSWSYEEHVPGSSDPPPADTLLVRLPFPPASDRYALVESLLREVTPAHVDIVLVSSGGFLLDQSQLDQEGLGI